MQPKDWILIAGSVFGGGTLVGALAYFISPASQRLAAKRKDADGRRLLTAGVIALGGWGDVLRDRVLQHEPNAAIDTSAQVLTRVRANLEALDSREAPGGSAT